MNNPYATPAAEVRTGDKDEIPLYVVGRGKLLALGVLTFSYYFIYWHYRNWRLTKLRNGDDTWPMARAVFQIFFTHALFTTIDEELKTKKIEHTWNPMIMATIIVVFVLFGAIFDRLAGNSLGSPITDLLVLGSVLLLPFLYLRPQRAINIACGDPTGSTNKRLTLANGAWILLGLLFWALILVGLFAEVFYPELLVE